MPSLTVNQGDRKTFLQFDTGISLLELLKSNGFYVPSACLSAASCGKCRIRFLSQAPSPTEADRRFIKTPELAKGIRLACQCYPKTDCEISIISAEETGFAVITENEGAYEKEVLKSEEKSDSPLFGIAIDLGTTTIAMQLADLCDGHILSTYTSANSQRRLGADVISRISLANNGKLELLQRLVLEDLANGIKVLLNAASQLNGTVVRAALAGNTVMIHLLLGYPCDTLGVYPFKPYNTALVSLTGFELLKTLTPNGFSEIPITIFPGISAYVGGDIVSGIYYCKTMIDALPENSTWLFVDLGTNGEMAIGSKGHILCSSAAAGPAFEGGNISCGVGSINGAISHVVLTTYSFDLDCNDKAGNHVPLAHYETIGNRLPVGLCGTGVVDVLSELLSLKLIDETGRMTDELNDELIIAKSSLTGQSISFTQKDVREMQLAKSAICSGIEILCKNFGKSLSDISAIYLAGGFGYTISIENAKNIGLFGELSAELINAVGNTSLAGAVRLLMSNDTNTLNDIVASAKEMILSEDKDFNDIYVENMYFE